MLEDREDARDVVQQVFIKQLKEAFPYCSEKGRPAAWLAAITRNQPLDRIRQLKTRRSLRDKLRAEAAVAGGSFRLRTKSGNTEGTRAAKNAEMLNEKVVHFTAEVDPFSESVRKGRVLCTLEELGFVEMRVLAAIMEAACTSRTVSV